MTIAVLGNCFLSQTVSEDEMFASVFCNWHIKCSCQREVAVGRCGTYWSRGNANGLLSNCYTPVKQKSWQWEFGCDCHSLGCTGCNFQPMAQGKGRGPEWSNVNKIFICRTGAPSNSTDYFCICGYVNFLLCVSCILIKKKHVHLVPAAPCS